MNNLVTITAATDKRHFYVQGATYKLTLRHVKLVGGDVSTYSWPAYFGGSIFVDNNGGELNLYSSIISNNKAQNGGGIGAYENMQYGDEVVIINIYNCTISNNDAVGTYGSGGGIALTKATGTIINTTIDQNEVTSSGGGMSISKVK